MDGFRSRRGSHGDLSGIPGDVVVLIQLLGAAKDSVLLVPDRGSAYEH